MQDFLNNTVVVIIVSTGVIIIFAIGYLAVVVSSHKRIIAEQHSKIDEIRRSEERYKTLFENSVAGMMKFNFTSWAVLEANQTLLDMFNCTNVYQLQRTFTDMQFEEFYQIESSLAQYGAVDSVEIHFAVQKKIIRRFLFSARREGETEIAHAVVIFMTAQKRIG